ncbi:MAG: threonine/serine exporter family protein [Christensenellales bacterium]
MKPTRKRRRRGEIRHRKQIRRFRRRSFGGGWARVCVAYRRRGTNSRRIAMVNEISARWNRQAQPGGRMRAGVRKPRLSQRTMILAYGLAAASALFDGDAATFAVTFAIGVLAGDSTVARIQMGVLLGNFVGGWLTAVAAQMLYGVSADLQRERGIIGGIMPSPSGWR